MGLSFGNYDEICDTVALIVCPLLGSELGLEPKCYSRNVEINNTIIFQPATCFVHIAALIMTAIMIYHVRSKYTAVGRKEIVLFFYLYAVAEILAIFLDSAIIPTYSTAYAVFAAIYVGLGTAIYWCLLINGFVGFQFAEDGTPKSLWFLRISCVVLWLIGFLVALATFKSVGGLSPTKTVGLWVVQLLFPVVCVAIYVISQVILVLRTLDDRWPLGDITFGTLAFVAACVLMFGFSATICDKVKHYIDGTFFGTLCLLFAVMMTYKYWDSITKEDLEFSVGSKQSVWEVKDPLIGAGDVDVMGPASINTHESPFSGGHSSNRNNSPGRLAPGFGSKGSGYPPAGQYGGSTY
ncbi:Chitin synthase III catalytic subunit [Ceraceosorus bombacis]|uniref:Chitin synthase export chaperone n=1 Tax=Ceraceosorus bombacis TaxID=401625 RepID=A0A0P1BCN6_9BASI|nr:Chitin synthase III catalytic subunit [Ceraceosorus bombacis]